MDTNDFSMSAKLARIEKRGAEAAKTEEQKIQEKPQQLWLPGFDFGAFPNHLNRSSLIAPIARGRRKFHRQTEMVTRKDCVLEYTGEQLDEADGDLIMTLIAFAQPHKLGTAVLLNRKELLRKIKRDSIGSTQYQWLYRSMKRLREATMFLEARKSDGTTRYTVGKMTSFNILADLEYGSEGSESETYAFTLDPRWVMLFSNKEFSLIDWDKRMQIARGQDMAKTLQRLIATSDNLVQHYAIEWLKSKMEYTSPMRKFREALTASCLELKRLDIISSGKIERSTKGIEQLTLVICG